GGENLAFGEQAQRDRSIHIGMGDYVVPALLRGPRGDSDIAASGLCALLDAELRLENTVCDIGALQQRCALIARFESNSAGTAFDGRRRAGDPLDQPLITARVATPCRSIVALKVVTARTVVCGVALLRSVIFLTLRLTIGLGVSLRFSHGVGVGVSLPLSVSVSVSVRLDICVALQRTISLVLRGCGFLIVRRLRGSVVRSHRPRALGSNRVGLDIGTLRIGRLLDRLVLVAVGPSCRRGHGALAIGSVADGLLVLARAKHVH